MYVDLGERLRQARTRLDLSQEELADYVALPRSAISHIERGRQRPSVHTVLQMAQRLKLDVGELLGDLLEAPAARKEVLVARPVKSNRPDSDIGVDFIQAALSKAREEAEDV